MISLPSVYSILISKLPSPCQVAPIDVVPQSYIPALFGHATGDSFIKIRHSEALHAAYAGDKNLIRWAQGVWGRGLSRAPVGRYRRDDTVRVGYGGCALGAVRPRSSATQRQGKEKVGGPGKPRRHRCEQPGAQPRTRASRACIASSRLSLPSAELFCVVLVLMKPLPMLLWFPAAVALPQVRRRPQQPAARVLLQQVGRAGRAVAVLYAPLRAPVSTAMPRLPAGRCPCPQPRALLISRGVSCVLRWYLANTLCLLASLVPKPVDSAHVTLSIRNPQARW